MNQFNLLRREMIQRIDGFVPRYILLYLNGRRPDLQSVADTLSSTSRLWNGSAARDGHLHRFIGSDGKSRKEIYDAQEQESLPGVKGRFEEDPVSEDVEINRAFETMLIADKYYRAVHNLNSYDHHGATWKGVIRFGYKYDNAYWNSQYMVSGKGDGTLFADFNDANVWWHELGHAITEYEVNGGIDYWGQSGAINEHFSDVSASNVESWSTGKGLLPSQYHWLIGKNIFIPLKDTQNGKYWRTALRNMKAPGTGYNDPDIGKDRQPADMDHYVRTSSDNGGVHTNSGIVNRLYYLVAQGIEDAKLGHDWNGTFGRAARIWFAARPNLGNKPSFGQLGYWVREACAVEKDAESKIREVVDSALKTVKIVANKKAVDDATPDDGTVHGGSES